MRQPDSVCRDLAIGTSFKHTATQLRNYMGKNLIPANRYDGLKVYHAITITGPEARFSKVLITIRARSSILRAASIERWRRFKPSYQPDLFYQLRILLLSFQNQQDLSLLCKHRTPKIAFRARKVIATFEKRAPAQQGGPTLFPH